MTPNHPPHVTWSCFEVSLYGVIIGEVIGGLGDTEAGVKWDLVVYQGYLFDIVVKKTRRRIKKGRNR